MVRKIRYILTNTALGAMLAAGMFSTGCQDDVEVGKFDGSEYDAKTGEVYCMFRNADGPLAHTIELRNDETTARFYVELSKAADKGVDLSVKVSREVLDAYNEENKTAFEEFPGTIALGENGAVIIPPGDRRSDPVFITLDPGQTLTQGKTYAIPLKTEVVTPGIKLSEAVASSVLFVKAMGAIPSTDKGTGIVVIGYVECNSNNLLNVGEWFLNRSGKPLFDIVNIFAANINYLENEGRIGVTINPNIQHILDNRDTYIRPLQEMGIKVCLTILGNHDGTGVANLSDEAARDFAADLKSIVDTYGLDGVDFDDEWSDYHKYPTRPGCVKRSGDAYSRLCYETKRAMPDKLCTIYYIGAVTPDPSQDSYGFDKPMDGMFPGDYVDYSYYAQYGSISTDYTTILGMNKRQWGPSSIDVCNSPNLWNLDYVRKEGYGVQVVYDVRALGDDYAIANNHKNTFNAIAQKLFDDSGARWTGVNHW